MRRMSEGNIWFLWLFARHRPTSKPIRDIYILYLSLRIYLYSGALSTIGNGDNLAKQSNSLLWLIIDVGSDHRTVFISGHASRWGSITQSPDKHTSSFVTVVLCFTLRAGRLVGVRCSTGTKDNDEEASKAYLGNYCAKLPVHGCVPMKRKQFTNLI